MLEILKEFSKNIHQKLSTHIHGEPEDQLRAPFEELLKKTGAKIGFNNVIPVGETLLKDKGGRPDYGISIGKLLCGHVELKSLGKGADPKSFAGHDKKQWERFKNLPNILYSDGRDFSLYRMGKLVRSFSISGDPRIKGEKAVTADDIKEFEILIRDFLAWEPIVPSNSAQLVEYLAPLCRALRDDVLEALKNNVQEVQATANDWRRYLFPGADDSRFADAYAQTVTFSLLLARSNGSDTLFLDKAIESLTHANSLLARALGVLTDPLVKKHLDASLSMLQRVIDRVPTGTMSGGRRDPWLHFYEDFLSEYDPDLRRDAGAYYTPVEVVQAQVRIVDELLRNKLKKPHGFATGGVNVLDPAVGTGTYLLGVVEHALEKIRETEGGGALPARADVLGSSLYGFEIMVGPYAVASLRLTRMIQQYQGHLPSDGAQIMLNNTLESPHEKIPDLPLLYQPIGLEHKRAKRVKDTVPVLVCLGNPPYGRHAAATKENQTLTGGWVRWGELKDGKDAILEDFITPVKAAGKGGSLKNLYNLYVYFWRWALWKTFEHDLAAGPGIVSFITASSFIDGDAFLGMRAHMRQVCDEIWIIDLGGEGRGTRMDENVFAIKTPVAITVAVRYGGPQLNVPAKVNYTRIEGIRSIKLHSLEMLQSLNDLEFSTCPNEWNTPFRPEEKGSYISWPLLTDLIPWQHSGVQAKRVWPIGTTKDVLNNRWQHMLTSNRAECFKESTDRKVNIVYAQFHESSKYACSISDLPSSAPCPEPQPYGYRSFDRRFILADGRILSRPRTPLWHTASDQQIYLASLCTKPLGTGPALTVSAYVPDLDFFSGRGAKDILPLYRDNHNSKEKIANLHPQLLKKLESKFDCFVSEQDIIAYIYGLLSQPAFTKIFSNELNSREIRVPLTAVKDLFNQVVLLGRELLFLHTYGERFSEGQAWPKPAVKCLKAIPSGELPENYSYDSAKQVIFVDTGEFGPVSSEVWEYEVSGLKVVQSWLGYRMRNRKGKKSSPLDDINTNEWGSEYTTELLQLLNLLTRTLEIHSQQTQLLEDVIASPLILAAEFSTVPDEWRKAPSHNGSQVDMDL